MEEIPLPLTPDALLAQKEWVRRVARALVLDESSAEDLAQQVWVRALERPPRVRRSIRAWLGTVLRNAATDLRRRDGSRARREEAAARPEALPAAADVVARAEALQRVSRAALDLREPYRTAILLRYFEDLSPADIARRQDVPLETVRTRLRRGLELLREALDADHDGDRRAWMLALLPFAIPWTGSLLPGSFRPVEPGAWSGADAAARASLASAKELIAMNVRAVAAAALALLLSAGAAFWLLADLAPDVSPGDPAFPATGGRRAPPKPAARDLGGLPYVGSGVGVPTPPVTGERGTPVPPDATAGIQPGKGMPRSESAPAEGEVLESARRQAEERERVAAAMKARDAERLAEARAGWIVVRGVVVDGDTGTGLGGIPLQAYPTGAESMQVSAATAVDGTFEVRGTFKGAWSLGAGQRDSSSEYGQTLLKRNGRPDGDLRVELRRGLALEGRIEDADGKAFAGNATVLCWFLDEKGKPIPETQKWVFTATGEFRLRGLDPGPHLVRASAHGPPGREAEGAVSAVVPSVEAGTKGLVVRLPKAAPIEGRLTDENGNPVTVPGRVRIRVSGAAGGLLRKDIETVVPGDGTFRSAALDPGTEYDLETSGFEGFEVLKKAGVAGGTTDVVLVLIRVE